MEASVFIATSLDGFIARKDGDIDWLGDPEDDQDDYGYYRFMETIDYLVMGRNTYEKVLSFGIPWPYEKPVVVLTSRPLDLPDELSGKVEAMPGPVGAVAAALEERGAKHLYIDGGRTIQSFLAAGLVGRLILTRIPVLLGEGIPLFGPLPGDLPLKHVETRAFEDGFMQSEYEVM
ncbi:MAG: dihydrofolate reductase family protein [Planctomycetota bacterium]